jgi:hypothetical protein
MVCVVTQSRRVLQHVPVALTVCVVYTFQEITLTKYILKILIFMIYK